MQHYFVKDCIDNQFVFEKEDIHHILHVMRFRSGEQIVCIYNNHKYCSSLAINGEMVTANIINEISNTGILPVKVTIIHGMPKNDHFELALQKATELGVDCIVPFEAKYSVIKIGMADVDKKLQRWNKIVKEASEQSERSNLPTIMKPIKLKEIKNYLSDLNIVADERLARKNGPSYYQILKEKNYQSITILVGPEGGFSDEEFECFDKLGFIGVSFGKRVLRSETAVMYALAAISLISEE